MPKNTRSNAYIILLLAILFVGSASFVQAADEGLSLIAPAQCPQGGCAPGQRLNFTVQFSVSTQNPKPNVQVCVYAPANGQQGGGVPWADFDTGWISTTGLNSGDPYTVGQTNSICNSASNLEPGEAWLVGAYAQLNTGVNDALEFTLHIAPKAKLDGYVRVKVFERASDNGIWAQIANYRHSIELAEPAEIVYVAKTPADCGSYTPCYVNSGDDLEDGLGTGLRDAVLAVNSDAEIRVLKDYDIKDHAVLIDKKVHVKGQDNALITYIGNDCTEPMLKLVAGGSIEKLSINDGNCSNPSRHLIEIDSAEPVVIKHNTLTFGGHAVLIQDNKGDVDVAFNHIVNHAAYAVLRADGDDDGMVNIYANNITNNTTGYQANCNDKGTANHNYWGTGLSAASSAKNCIVSNDKQLGTLIRLATGEPGVEAQRMTVSSTMSYAFDGKVGARRLSGDDYDLIIVNHGQGAAINIPFYQSGSDNIQACSNFYDIFLADDAIANDLQLALKYNLNSSCVSQIESGDYCGGTDSAQYPLLWYDPAALATDGWNRTGQPPQGPGAGGVSGQETTCHLANKEIRVVIDNTGRPSISSDLNFTPFVIGLPLIDGITLTQFTAQFDGSKVNLKWVTSREVNVNGFYVLRAESSSGPYARISSQIDALGDAHIGGIYQYADSSIVFGEQYYYKIEVIDKEGNPIGTHGPVSIQAVTPTPTMTMTWTPTNTPTRTPTPTVTRTLFYYRSPTPYYYYATPRPPFYQPNTATPYGWPTPVRTYRLTPGDDFSFEDNYYYPGNDIDHEYDWGYPEMGTEQPADWDGAPPIDGYPAQETPTPTLPSITPGFDVDTPATGTEVGEEELPIQRLRWIFIIVGAAGGLSLLAAASVILVKSRFS